jgi:transaldolase
MKMEFFLDTASVEEVREAARWGVITGVTTNPSLMAREGRRDFAQTIRAIANIIDGPISAEVVSLKADDMVEEGRRYGAWHPNVVVKIPIVPEGLEAMSRLAAEKIRVNATLIFSANQALLCARAGAFIVSPFIGRMDDISEDGLQVVRDAVEIFRLHGIGTRVLAASIRHPRHLTEAAKAGAHIATVPLAVLKQAMRHPLTDSGLDRFLKDWARYRELRQVEELAGVRHEA